MTAVAGDVVITTACAAEPHRFDDARVYDRDEIAELRRLCRHCPLLAGCRDYTLSVDVAGFAAGMTALERRRAGAPYLDSAGHPRRREVAA